MWEQERRLREPRASFAAAVLLEEQGPMERDASEEAAVLAGFASMQRCGFSPPFFGTILTIDV